jgi:hypothetical protein
MASKYVDSPYMPVIECYTTRMELKDGKAAYLDLSSIGDDVHQSLQRLIMELRTRQNIVIIAGAGISVSAGSR